MTENRPPLPEVVDREAWQARLDELAVRESRCSTCSRAGAC